MLKRYIDQGDCHPFHVQEHEDKHNEIWHAIFLMGLSMSRHCLQSKISNFCKCMCSDQRKNFKKI
jgi:hypothetical protein